MKITSFPPIASDKATILILGSMPGETSLRLQQYYAHSGNLFWDIMERAFGLDKNEPYEERIHCLKDNGIAIWDVLKHCEREGSLDSDIDPDTEEPNDFVEFLNSNSNISHIFFNGKKAKKSFRKHVLPNLSPEIRRRISLKTLPSTSPANTRLSREGKIEKWKNQIDTARIGNG